MALAESEDTAESFVREADLALYRAKRGGRNQIAWHDPLAHTNP
jgi:PleD family two-component response regulator